MSKQNTLESKVTTFFLLMATIFTKSAKNRLIFSENERTGL